MDRNKSVGATENIQRKSLGEVLVEEHIITAEQLQNALELQRGQGGKLGDILVSQGLLKPEQVGRGDQRATKYASDRPEKAYDSA